MTKRQLLEQLQNAKLHNTLVFVWDINGAVEVNFLVELSLQQLDEFKKYFAAFAVDSIVDQTSVQEGNETFTTFYFNVGRDALRGFDPDLLRLIRPSLPSLTAFDVAGVQPLKAPAGLIFAMKSRYSDEEVKKMKEEQ